MTLRTDNAFNNAYDSLVKVAGRMLTAAQDGSATPQDVIETLDNVVDELTELRQAVPGGQSEQQQEAPAQKPQEQPQEKGAALETDTAEESREKVSEQNSAQKALQAQLDELKEYKLAKEKEEIAEQYAELFEPRVQQAKYDEVIASQDSIDTWNIRISALQEFTKTDSVKPAKNTTVWIPQKNAKLKSDSGRTKFL